MRVDSSTGRRQSVLAIVLAAATFGTAGCGLAVLGVATRGTPAPHRIELKGEPFPAAPFRAAAQAAGGVVTVDSSEFLRAELREAAVALELQTLRPGQYQLVGSALQTGAFSRLPFGGNKVEETTRKVAEQVASAGYQLVLPASGEARPRERGRGPGS